MFLLNIPAATFSCLLSLFDSESVSSASAVYEIKRSLTPLGWAAIVIFPTALILGLIYLTVKILRKRKIK